MFWTKPAPSPRVCRTPPPRRASGLGRAAPDFERSRGAVAALFYPAARFCSQLFKTRPVVEEPISRDAKRACSPKEDAIIKNNSALAGVFYRRSVAGKRRSASSGLASAVGAGSKPQLHNLEHPILVRPGTPDVTTIVNNIVREEYGKFAPPSAPLKMIDAGAYIGDSSAYFASKYPDLKIVALEPHPANHALAKQNLEAYGERVMLLNMARGSTRETVMISGEHDNASVGGGGAPVEATTVPDLFQRMGWERINILKMDIEGAEADVLGPTADAWLDRVDMLIIELHGSECERQVSETLDRNGFAVKLYRSLWYCAREPRRA